MGPHTSNGGHPPSSWVSIRLWQLCEAMPWPSVLRCAYLSSPLLAYFLIFCPRNETEIRLLSRSPSNRSFELAQTWPELCGRSIIFVNATFRSRNLFRSGPSFYRYYPPIRADLLPFIKAHVTAAPRLHNSISFKRLR